MGKSVKNNINWPHGTSPLTLDSTAGIVRRPDPSPEAVAAAALATDAAMAEVAERLGWSQEQCLFAAAAGKTGWPEGFIEIDDLAAIIAFENALAAERDAAATLQAPSEASQS